MYGPVGDNPDLSTVVTVYTESLSIIETVDRLLKSGPPNQREILLVVAPKASEETKKICADLAAKHDIVRFHIQTRFPGAGWALQEGMKLARYDAVAIMSADLETEPEAVARMYWKMVETGADVVIGNRWARTGGGFHNYDPLKYVCNWIFQQIFKRIYRTRVSDLTYGFKILRKHVINSIQWESQFHEIYIETTVKPLKMGYRVEQVPTVWIGRREGRSVNTLLRNFGYVRLALRVAAAPASATAVPAPALALEIEEGDNA
jgi:dolichol-phosphate mannosyltransferase